MEYLDPMDFWGTQQDQRIADANKVLSDLQNRADKTSLENKGLYKQYLDKVNDTYGDTASKYSKYLSDLESQVVPESEPFNFNKDLNDYYSKFANQRQNKAMNAIANSRANAGSMFSSDYLNELGAKQQALASEEWDKAYQKYMQDRSQSLNEFNVNQNLAQQNYQNRFNKANTMLNVAGNAQDNLSNAYGSYISNMAGQNNANLQNYANIAQQQAANEASRKSLIQRVFG